jgi:hypothetical protein
MLLLLSLSPVGSASYRLQFAFPVWERRRHCLPTWESPALRGPWAQQLRAVIPGTFALRIRDFYQSKCSIFASRPSAAYLGVAARRNFV